MKEQETSFRELQLDEVKKLIDDGYDVVDVREDWEWNKGHLPGARHVVLSSILANPTAQKFEDKTVFVCQAGERSAVASEMAVALGVKDVVNFLDLGLVYDIAIKPARVDVKMTLTALGCPMAADVMADVRDHLLTLPGIADAGVDIVYEPVWTPERMSEEARWELGMV